MVLQLLAQCAHRRGNGRLNGLRGEITGIQGRNGIALRYPSDIGRHTVFRPRILRRRERRKQQEQQYEYRRFHVTEKICRSNVVQIRETNKSAAGILLSIPARRPDAFVSARTPRPEALLAAGQKKAGDYAPARNGIACGAYLRTLTMILRTVPSPTIGAWPSSGKSTVN